MGFTIRKTTKAEDAAEFIAGSILNQLNKGRRVLFFLTGGSSISVGVKISEIFRNGPNKSLLKNLTVTLTDERYGEIDHANSNWHQLMRQGFRLPGAKLSPILIPGDCATSVQRFNVFLKQEFRTADYKIGLFGIGKDGHTAGILPESAAVECKDFVCGYDAPPFSRVTITPKAVEALDEAVVFAQGEEKWSAMGDLLERDIDIKKQPAQILKKVPLLIIFSDYQQSA